MTRLLGVDYGERRIGLAISDPERRFAWPFRVHERKEPARDAEYFQRLIEEEKIDRIVVGLPIRMGGEEGQRAAEARAFGKWLHKVTGRPVVFWDERFTTAHAEQLLWGAGLTHKQRKARRDKVAAQIILQTYLDAGCPESPEIGPLEEE